MRKCTRPSPALPYCKRREAGQGPGNEAIYLVELSVCTSVGALLSTRSQTEDLLACVLSSFITQDNNNIKLILIIGEVSLEKDSS